MSKETPAAEVKALAAEYDPSQNFSLDLLKGDGSDRKIFFLQSQSKQETPIVGVYHENLTENRDFILISAKMREAGILVPEIFRVARSEKAYLLQYLGAQDYYRLCHYRYPYQYLCQYQYHCRFRCLFHYRYHQ